MRVLLVANRSRFTAALTSALTARGHHVARGAATDLDQLTAPPPDLVLVSLGNADGDGAQVCRALRERTDVAIIGLAEPGKESDGVAALREGADDYVSRPVTLEELLARIGAVLRRTRPGPAGVRTIGELRVDLDRHEASVEGVEVLLTRKEFALLAALAWAPGEVVTRDRLMAEVWRMSADRRSRTLDSHITTLRTKLGTAATVENVRGVGYRIVRAGQ